MKKHAKEDFWNDCYENRNNEIISIYFPYYRYPHNYGRNIKNNKNVQNRKNYSMSASFSFSPKKKKNKNVLNKTVDHSYLEKIYENHPFFKEYIETNRVDRELELRKKNSMIRCFGLYAYGLEIKRTKLLNEENNKKDKIKDEITKCTFRPKISDYSKSKKPRFNMGVYINKFNFKNKKKNKNKNVINIKKNNNLDYKIIKSNHKNNKNMYFNSDDEGHFEECTFRPKINKKNVKKMFDKTKSLANEKDNDQFFFRYNKARDEHMIKKIKQISSKDESYETMLLALANRINKQTKYGFNDGGYDIRIKKNNKKYELNGFKDLSIDYKRQNNDKNIRDCLRNELLDINLNDEESS